MLSSIFSGNDQSENYTKLRSDRNLLETHVLVSTPMCWCELRHLFKLIATILGEFGRAQLGITRIFNRHAADSYEEFLLLTWNALKRLFLIIAGYVFLFIDGRQ